MKVVITGGAGFIGWRLARRVLEIAQLTAADGSRQAVDEVILFDAVAPHPPPSDLGSRARLVLGDVEDARAIGAVIDRPETSVFHLASVVSAGAEQDFDLAMKVNLNGLLNVLNAARAHGAASKVIFSSSIAVFGGSLTKTPVGDLTKQTPLTTYGMTKAMGELLINDYSRKGYVDGRSARLPSVIIRPGRPNKAASSFASGIFREPLNGEDITVPVEPTVRMAVAGYRAIVEGLVRLHETDHAALGDDRALNFPAISVTAADMAAALQRVGGERKLGAIWFRPDPKIEAIVAGWPSECRFDRAAALGFPRDPDLDCIVRDYIADYLDR